MENFFEVYISFIDEFYIIGSKWIILLSKGTRNIRDRNHIKISFVFNLRLKYFEYYFNSIIKGDEF